MFLIELCFLKNGNSFKIIFIGDHRMIKEPCKSQHRFKTATADKLVRSSRPYTGTCTCKWHYVEVLQSYCEYIYIYIKVLQAILTCENQIDHLV
jgi:hypothetical protein